jgi:hypothetical protein
MSVPSIDTLMECLGLDLEPRKRGGK